MTDLTAFEPLYRALASTVSALRLRSGDAIRGISSLAVTGGQATAARRSLTELVPYERNLTKLFDGLRTGQLSRFRWAGHQLVAHVLLEYVLAGASADSTSPVWDLPVTDDLVELVLSEQDEACKAVQDLKRKLRPDQVARLLEMEGTTVRQLADDLRVKQKAAHRARLALRQVALERAKQVLSEQDLELLLDKTLY